MSRQHHQISRTVNAISYLSSLTSPYGPRGTTHTHGEAVPNIRQAIDWETIDEHVRLKILDDIKDGTGKLDSDRLFWLLRSLARLDINLFEINQRLASRIIQNLKDNDENNSRLNKPTENELPAFHFPKAIWALSIFLRKYCGNDDDLKNDLLDCLQEKLDILAEKAIDLETRNNEIFHLAKTKIFLRPFLNRLQWPEALDRLVTDEILRGNEEYQSSLERNVISVLEKFEFKSRFEVSYWDEDSAHTIDIAFPEEKIAIEVEGPGHFYAQERRTTSRQKQLQSTRHIDIKTWERDTVLEDNGWTVITIPYYEWQACRNKADYLQEKLSGSLTIKKKTTPRAARAPAESAPAVSTGSRYRLLAELGSDDDAEIDSLKNTASDSSFH